MELVEGDDLSQRIARGPIPLVEAFPIAKQIADALEAAHEQNIIHRDLKPANIKVRSDGTAKVLDFGLAKAMEPAATPNPNVTQSPTITTPATMTGVGVILGTAAYMSPEQAKGKPIDKRADIWAFGCLLYEMLTGQRAFRGEDVTDTLSAVLRDQPDWTALPASTPDSVRRLLVRCLERDPKARLRDMGDARLEITAAENESLDRPRAGVRDRAGWPHRAIWLALGAAVGAGALGTWGRYQTPARPVARLMVIPPADLPLRVDSEAPDVAITRDGRRIIYQSRRSDPDGARVGATQLISRDVNSFEASAIPNLGLQPQVPFASPDGAWIGFATSVGAKVAPVLAKAPVKGGALVGLDDLSGLGELCGASWTADGRIVFATSDVRTGLLEVTASGGTRKVLTTPDATQGERDHLWPEVLPDGAGTLFTISREGGRFDAAVLPAGQPKWRVIVRGGTMPHYIASGHLVYVAGGVLYGVGFDLRTLKVTTEPVPLVTGVLAKESGAADFAIAANGTLVYVAGAPPEVLRRPIWLHLDGTSVALPLDARPYRDARLSPDGRRVAFTIQDRGVRSIWVYDTGRDTFTRITPERETVQDPVWSTDGRRLAYWSDSDRGLFTIAVDGSDRSDRLATVESGRLYPSAWSANDTLAFIQERPSLSLFAVTAHPPHVVRPLAVGDGAQVEGSFSPDGRWLAHMSVASDGGVPEVVVGPAAGGGRQWPIAPSGRYPTWTPDGRAVLYIEGGAIYRVGIESEREDGWRGAGVDHALVNRLSLASVRQRRATRDGQFVTIRVRKCAIQTFASPDSDNDAVKEALFRDHRRSRR